MREKNEKERNTERETPIEAEGESERNTEAEDFGVSVIQKVV